MEINRTDLAGDLYNEYCRAVGGVAFNGQALPEWKEFSADPAKNKQTNGWFAVADFVADRIAYEVGKAIDKTGAV